MNSRHPTRRFTHPTLDQREPSAAAVVASLGWLRARDAAGDTAGHTAGDAEVEGSALRDSVPAPVASHALGHALTHAPSRARVARLLAASNGVSAVSTANSPLRCSPRTAALAAFALLAGSLFFARPEIFSLHDRELLGSLPTAHRPSGMIESPSEGRSERGFAGGSTTRRAPRSSTLRFNPQGANEMHRNQFLAAVAGVGVVAAGAAAQDAVQWRVEDGGNGHWYIARSIAAGRTWDSARTEAEADGAHLATFSNAAEYSFCVAQLVDRADLWFDGSWGPFIGGLQEKGAQAPTLGWIWIDGSDWYADWGLANCGADDSCGDQRYLAFGRCVTDGVISFNDEYFAQPPAGSACTRFPARSALLEWSADCNSDGIVDYGQIRSGELEDVNANGVPDCCDAGVACTCPADIDGNNEVNGIDLAIILDKWGTNGGKDYPNADIDRDGTINGADLAQVLGSWGPCQ